MYPGRSLQSKGLPVWLVMQAIPFYPGQPHHFQEKNTTIYKKTWMHLYLVIFITHFLKNVFHFPYRNTMQTGVLAEANIVTDCSHFVMISACA